MDGNCDVSIYHGVERQGGVAKLYKTLFKFQSGHKVELVRWVLQVVCVAYLQGCAPHPRQAFLRCRAFEARSFGRTHTRTLILEAKYGLSRGTIATVFSRNDKNDGYRALSEPAGKSLNLLDEQQGCYRELIEDHSSQQDMPLDSTIVGGQLLRSGGHWADGVADGMPAQVWLTPSGPWQLVGSRLDGCPVMGVEQLDKEKLQKILSDKWAEWRLMSGVVADGFLVEFMIDDGRRFKIPAGSRSMHITPAFESACAQTPDCVLTGLTWTEFGLCVGLAGLGDGGFLPKKAPQPASAAAAALAVTVPPVHEALGPDQR